MQKWRERSINRSINKEKKKKDEESNTHDILK